MRILLKCPTRGRRDKFLSTIRKWVELAARPESLGIAVSLDTDDPQILTEDDLPNVAWKRVYRSPNTTKIQACNADMDRIDWNWEIVVLVSDDMIPQVPEWDMTIRTAMDESLDHVVWIYDGFQNERLNTLNIFGRKRYEAWGYLYHPAYKSFFCDNELTDWCRAHPKQCTILKDVLVKHEHPLATGVQSDALYTRNQAYFEEDAKTYDRRKAPSRFGFLKLLSRR